MTARAIGSWEDVEGLLGQEGAGSVLRVPHGWLPHPLAHGMRPTVGLPLGQLSDFVKPCDLGNLRVERHRRHDLVWLEGPPKAPEGLDARPDEPFGAAARGVALGAILGAALGRTPAAVVVGAAACGLLAMASSARVR